MAVVAALLALLLGDGPLESRSAARNATASIIVERAPALGIDFDANDEHLVRPASSDVEAFQKAGFGIWLESQLKVPDDSIGEPPGQLRTFLEDRRAALDTIVAALAREPPEWKEWKAGDPVSTDLLPSIRVQRLLLAAALVAERNGDTTDAERFVEALLVSRAT